MRLEDLNESQKLELKQDVLTARNDDRGEGTSYDELARADELVSDEALRDYCEGTKFSEDDFTCSSNPAFQVRVTWPVHKTFQVPAASKEEALDRMRIAVENGNLSCWDPGWEADDGDDAPKIEIVED